MGTNENFISKSKDEVMNDNEELVKKFREQKHNNALDFGGVVNTPIDFLLKKIIYAPSLFTESQRKQIIEMACISKKMWGFYDSFGFYVNMKELDENPRIRVRELISDGIEVSRKLLEKCVSDPDASQEEKEDIVKKVYNSMKLYGTELCLRMPIIEQIGYAKKDMVQFIRNNVEIYKSLGDIQFEDGGVLDRILELAKQKAEQLCGNLEKIDSIEYGKPEWFNLRNVISEVFFENVANDFSGDSLIRPYFCFDDGNVEVCMYKEGFKTHVLSNIIRNLNFHAFCDWDGFCKEKIVVVLCRYEEDKISLFIANNGKPFEGDVESVFEYGKGNGTGEGIGLYSARKFLEFYGATIGMSKAAEDGAREINVGFHIEIPIKEK